MKPEVILLKVPLKRVTSYGKNNTQPNHKMTELFFRENNKNKNIDL